MQLELTVQEFQELTDLVRAAHSDMGSEIHHARDNQYRETLRTRRLVLEGLLKRLETEMQMAA